MLLHGPEARSLHGVWALVTGVATAAAVAWYLAVSAGTSWAWPSGGSLPGLVTGVTGGLLIAFEMLLWPRKALRRYRLGRTKYWMAAHIWLGLLTLPLLLLHGRFHFHVATSTLAAVLLWLLVLVFASGVFGLYLQNRIPRLLLEAVPAETIHSQIPRVLAQFREEADVLVAVTCGRGADAPPGSAEPDPTFLVSARVRQVGRTQGKVAETAVALAWVPGAEALEVFYRLTVEPFLSDVPPVDSPLLSARETAVLFDELKLQLPPGAHPAAGRLLDLCDQRRQFGDQLRLHRWLHAWLVGHFALSIALVVLMLVHTYLALRYL